jgi:integrase/recombinase XerD
VRTRAAGRPPFGAHLDAFVEHLRVRRCSSTYERGALLVLPRFFSLLRDERVSDLRAVTEEHLDLFDQHLRAAKRRRDGMPLSVAHRRWHLFILRRFFAFLEKRGVILRNPATDLVLPKVDSLPRLVLTPRQAEKLMNAPLLGTADGQRDRALLEVLYGCGLRRGECLRLDLSDVDLHQKVLLVRNAKGKKDRIVPLPGRAAIALDLYLREGRPRLERDPWERALFLSCNSDAPGRRLARNSMNLIVERHAKAAGLKGVHPHALRHSCATHMLRGGADLRHVQQLLGHSHINSTTIYTRVAADDLRKALTRHPREKRRVYRRRPG